MPASALGANERVRVGIIGAGDRGVELANQIRACQNTEVAAFADIYSRRLERAGGLVPTARLEQDYRKLLDDPSLDAVVIATPPHLHAAQFCAALDAGKHVYQEKVLAIGLPHANRMRDAYLLDNGRHAVQIGHQACSSGHASDAARFLASPDHLGTISGLAMRHYRNTPLNKTQGARPALLTNDVNAQNIAWDAFAADSGSREFDPYRFIHWRHFWDYSGGPISENMSQQLAFWYKVLAPNIPSSATMSGGTYVWRDGRETPDTVTVSFELPEQMQVTWSAGFANNHLGVSEDLLGNAGTISRSNQIRYFPQKLVRPGATEMLGHSTQAPNAHMQNFFDAVRFGTETNCPFEIGYRVAVACIMAVESYQQARAVGWDPQTQNLI